MSETTGQGSSGPGNSGQGNPGPGELAQARENILRAMLVHVPFDGWSERALDAAIGDCGLDGPLSRLAFQGGIAGRLSEVAEYYARHADERMVAALDPAVLKTMKVRARIAHVLYLRFEQAAGERDAVRGLMNWLALPGNQALGTRCLYRTVDAMWHGIGDASTDFNFYTKRAMLAAVVGATVLFWLGDDSEGQAATRDFIDRRLAEVMEIEKAKARFGEVLSKLPDSFKILRDIMPRRQPPTENGPPPPDDAPPASGPDKS